MSGIDPRHLLKVVIRPAIEHLGMGGANAEMLLLGTAAVESRCGFFLTQSNGPAKGIFQMEPETEQDIFENYLKYRPELDKKVACTMSHMGDRDLETNLIYQACMARLKYVRAPGKLPDYRDLEGQAAYWKTHYNTYKGAGTIERYISDFERHIKHHVGAIYG